MLNRILTPLEEHLLYEERGHLSELDIALARLDAPREDLDALERSIRQLDKLFLLVVVGEFNSGKSTFINALLGNKILDEGVTPTTDAIHLLGFGAHPERLRTGPDLEEITAPIELLQQVQIVDTPGTNALDRRHETITADFVPAADLVLFITSADRPFTESERAFMERVREWGKKLVLVANKIDFLRLTEDVSVIKEYLREKSLKVLGFEPDIFAVSSLQALDAKLAGNDELLAKSRFPEFERYLRETLDDQERVRLKLLNPLGVGLRLAGKYLAALDGRKALLKDDTRRMTDIDDQLALFEEDLRREFRFRLADVDNILHQFEKRGQEFLDETLRLARIIDLMNKAKTKADFQRKVIADAPREIEQKIDQIIDWMIGAELKQWEAIGKHLAEARTRHSDQLVGEIGTFEFDRQRLLDTVGRTAQRTIESFDQDTESSRLAESVQTAVAGTALLEVGAIGLGAIVTLMATTQLADVTGILAAGSLAALGLLILPMRRRRAKTELSDKITALRDRLMHAVTEQFDRETEQSAQRIREAIAPYTRFVRAERERIDRFTEELRGKQTALETLKKRIEAL